MHLQIRGAGGPAAGLSEAGPPGDQTGERGGGGPSGGAGTGTASQTGADRGGPGHAEGAQGGGGRSGEAARPVSGAEQIRPAAEGAEPHPLRPPGRENEKTRRRYPVPRGAGQGSYGGVFAGLHPLPPPGSLRPPHRPPADGALRGGGSGRYPRTGPGNGQGGPESPELLRPGEPGGARRGGSGQGHVSQ